METSDEKLTGYAAKIYNIFVESSVDNSDIQKAYDVVQERWGEIESGDEVDVLFFQAIKFAISCYSTMLQDEKYDAELLAKKVDALTPVNQDKCS